ncbi:RNA-binding protein 28-like, partial [Pollicipes pollicipes]|uniref:RNA-binding protein 28-like n=1 Tax=Pollicipes pollicipes TaxID=41117 RepID=UPI001884A0E7
MDLLVGCGFIQYKHEKHAEEAIRKRNTKPFLGRPIVVDWAVDKARYEAAQKPAPDSSKGRKRTHEDVDEEGEGGEEEDDGSIAHRSSEKPDSAALDSSDDESEGEEEEDEEGGSSSGEEESDEGAESGDSEPGSDADSGVEGEDSDDDSPGDDGFAEDNASDDGAAKVEANFTKQKRERKSDVSEGTTLFIKNMSFDTDKNTLKELFSQFGRVKYALICIDPLTEHPRGTAFVQFKSGAEAEAALAAAADPDNTARFTLDDRRIEVLPAVDRRELQQRRQLDKGRAVQGKDRRNLYLAREGLVREGSRAAEGVSRADLNKRVGLEKWKTKMLKNLNMFVSTVRLCVHNVPADVDDAKLRQIFQSGAPAGAQITEARVMRDRRDVTSHPRGQSKEYGFVTFAEHEQSLAALRNINNNPEIFTQNRRPIVEFAVENRTALEARRRREEKSRQMNTQAAPAP